MKKLAEEFISEPGNEWIFDRCPVEQPGEPERVLEFIT
jgi:hypothetical protein